MDVLIDPVLLEALRAGGMTDRTIAIHAAGVLAHDARSVRAMGVAGPGMASFEDDVVMAPVRLAHGVHWCGGMVRLVDAHRRLPEAALTSMEGRPLAEALGHPAIPRDATVTGTRHLDASRFRADLFGSMDDVPVTIIETDSRPVTLRLTRVDRIAAPFHRAWGDRGVVDDVTVRLLSPHTLSSLTMLAATIAYIARTKGMGTTAAVAIGVGVAVAWFCLAALGTVLRGARVDDHGLPHLRYRRSAKEEQNGQGMWDDTP